ncbi:MAG: hypothetical protein HKP18_06705, partial [Acidimicrobiia bacterium]|nr:hypothetical protein [Acidimicrobiia bacterium]
APVRGRSRWLGIAGAVIVFGACTSSPRAPSTTGATTPTTVVTAEPVELDREYRVFPDSGQMEIRVAVTGAVGERLSLVGLGAELAPVMRIVDDTGLERAAGIQDPVMVDFSDLTYVFESADPLTLLVESTDGRSIRRLTIETSPGVTPTLAGTSRAVVPPGGTFRYEAAGDVVGISTNGIFENPNYRINGAIVLEQVGGGARYSDAAAEFDSSRGRRWHGVRGVYDVTVTGEIGHLSLGTLDTGLISEADIASACRGFDGIQRRQLATGDDLRAISEVIARSITGGDLGDTWLDDLKSVVSAAGPAIEELRLEYEVVREGLPSFFGQDLVDVENGVYQSWVRLRDAAEAAVSPRQFFEQIAMANDARLLRIGETAAFSLENLDAFTTQVCGFSIRSPEFGIET